MPPLSLTNVNSRPAVLTLSPPSAPDLLRDLRGRAGSLGRQPLAQALGPVLALIEASAQGDDLVPTCDAALDLCRDLYAGARSREALPLARAVHARATRAGDEAALRRAAIACGLLSADLGDVVGALDCHVQSLRLAGGDPLSQSRIWNNIGLALASAGAYELAARGYQRSLALVADVEEPVFSRYAASSNLANCHSQLGDVDEGLRHANRALLELTPAFAAQDPLSAVLLRRNLVRLLVAAGRAGEAQPHAEALAALPEATMTPRMRIAAATARAAFELATGRADIALTRLDQALALARGIPAVLRDTLAWIIRAEEAAGHAERAWLRFQELSEHSYRFAVGRAHDLIELDAIVAAPDGRARSQEARDRARLVAKLEAPRQPEGWETLRHLAVSAALRFDATGWHGVRVGALTKGLALASGVASLQALEYGLAAELHDIGMVCVPERVLARRGPFNAQETALVRRHAEAGAEILRDDRHPRVLLAREIARYHHARWDGEGYPERVGGRFIPLAARMCAVADAYDAMVCGLAGRPPLNLDDALDELGRCAGTHFDPELVRRFDTFIRDEAADSGIDPSATPGMASFQGLVHSLLDDQGYA